MLVCTFRYRTAAHLHFMEAAAAQLDVRLAPRQSECRRVRRHLVLGASIVGAYVVGIAAVVALATWVHCLGDPKFEAGCGGAPLYAVFWIVFALPGLLVTLVVVFMDELERAQQVRIAVVALGLQLLWFYVSWLTRWIDSLEMLGQWVVWAALAIAARVIVLASGRSGQHGRRSA